MSEDLDIRLTSVEEKLRDEGMNREIKGKAMEFHYCLVHCLRGCLLKVDRSKSTPKIIAELNNLDKLKDVVEMKKKIVDVMRELKECLKPFLPLLVDDLQLEESPNDENVNRKYEDIIQQFTFGRVNHSTVKLCLFAAATSIKTTIYVIDENLQWEVFQPLLSNDLALDYITMYNSDDKFYMIKSPNRCASPQKAYGLLGKFVDQLEDDEELKQERKHALRNLDYAILHKNESVTNFIKSCRLIRKELDDRRREVTDVVIMSSGFGIVSGAMVFAGVVLMPFTAGVSLGLGVGGGILGVGSGAVTGGVSAHEAYKQLMKMKEIETLQATVDQKENKVSEALTDVILLFEDEDRARNLNAKGIEKKICGLRTFFAALRSADGVANVALAVAKVGGKLGKAVALALAPLSIALDIGVMVEAVNTKKKGNKTEAGIRLENTAHSAEIKHVLFNSIMRGDCDSRYLLFTD